MDWNTLKGAYVHGLKQNIPPFTTLMTKEEQNGMTPLAFQSAKALFLTTCAQAPEIKAANGSRSRILHGAHGVDASAQKAGCPTSRKEQGVSERWALPVTPWAKASCFSTPGFHFLIWKRRGGGP